MNRQAPEIIEAMDPISLSELDGARLMDRVDTKYVLNEKHLCQLFEHTQAHYRVLAVNNVRVSAYSTLYYDSPECNCFLQHHNGKLNRYKYRMREYASSGLCFFEIKKKNNKGRTDKRRVPLEKIEQVLSANLLDFTEGFVGSRPQLIPQLWTNFSRITLVHRHRPERVTLDCDLSFRFGNDHQQLPGIVIAEIKQERDNRHTAVRVQLRQQRVPPLRVSKYCLGTMLLKPQLKSNRLKPKLHAIRRIA